MKKAIKILAVLVVLLSIATTVYATTEDELIAYLSKSFTIAGQKISMPTEYVKEAKRYVATYDISSEEADKVIAKIDEGVALMNRAGVADVNSLSKAQKQNLLSIAQEAASAVGAKISYTQGTGLTVIGEDGKVFGTYQVSSKNSNKFVQTGSDYMIYYVAGAAIIAIVGIAGYRKIKNSAN